MAGSASPRSLRSLLIRRREVWQLTWTARLVLLALIVALAITLARHAGTFLALTDPVDTGYLVVEGWMPAYTYERAGELWRSGHYRKVIAAGAYPDDALSNGTPREYVAVGSLVAAGIPRDAIALAMGAAMHQDRTFHAALNVRRWLQQRSDSHAALDVLTQGPHARRSRLLYRAALGEGVEVGVIAVPDRRFDVEHWWRTSEGVRSVLGESIAYVYARIFFDESDHD